MRDIINDLQRIADRKCYPEDILDGSIAQYWVDILEDNEHEIERLNNIINELEKWYKKQYDDINKCLDYAREYHNLQDTEKYTRDHNMIAMCIEKLDKLQELKEGK